MNIALIGMSNIGKTRWSRRLANSYSYNHVECDMLVEQKLGNELTRLGYSGIHDVAKWMGQPYEPRYAETSRKYLECERAVMLETFDRLDASFGQKPSVIDTTGSVIYTGDDVRVLLKAKTRIVYFEASAGHAEQLFQRYMASPKPVIWGDMFNQHQNETREQALQRSYPQLLASRAQQYQQLADVVIPFEIHKKPDADIRLLLGLKQ